VTCVKRTPLLLPATILAVTALALSACGGSTPSASSATSSAAASPSGAIPGSGAISAGPDAAIQWCKAYAEITTAMSAAQPTVDGGKTSLNALQSFDQLWAAGANLGYITTEESDANRRAIVAYSQMMKLVADGKKVDSQEVKDASANLTTVTGKDKALLQSSSGKVETLCAPLTATVPSTSASSGTNGTAGPSVPSSGSTAP
jgi:hypothetical protein